MVVVMILTLCSRASATKDFKLSVNSDKLMYALVKKENPSKNKNAIGDKKLRHHAYGWLQIRKPNIDDVMRIVGKKEVRKYWGKSKLSEMDMKNFAKAKWVCRVYLSYYGKRYTKKTGKTPTLEVYARIHNGGPLGWKKCNTLKYGKDVLKYAKTYSKSHKIS